MRSDLHHKYPALFCTYCDECKQALSQPHVHHITWSDKEGRPLKVAHTMFVDMYNSKMESVHWLSLEELLDESVDMTSTSSFSLFLASMPTELWLLEIGGLISPPICHENDCPSGFWS